MTNLVLSPPFHAETVVCGVGASTDAQTATISAHF